VAGNEHSHSSYDLLTHDLLTHDLLTHGLLTDEHQQKFRTEAFRFC
jgi:hypothetical protein